jgi:TolB-like protein
MISMKAGAKARRASIGLGAALWAAVSLAGCARFVHVEETDLLRKTDVRRIAVLPFRSDLYVRQSERGGELVVTCLYDGKTFPLGRIRAGALQEVTADFTHQLVLRGGYDVVLPGETEALVKRRRLDPAEMSPAAFFGAIGEGLDVDAVLAGNVFRYQELRGSAFGAESTASVTIDVHLIEARSGKLLWAASYSEAQAALTENVGSLGMVVQRGARFLTVSQLGSWAVEQILDRFPEPRGRKKAP